MAAAQHCCEGSRWEEPASKRCRSRMSRCLALMPASAFRDCCGWAWRQRLCASQPRVGCLLQPPWVPVADQLKLKDHIRSLLPMAKASSHGGKRAGAGRKKKVHQKVTVKKRSPYQVRTLLGVEKAEYHTKTWSTRNPVTFLAIATIVFYFTRSIMQSWRQSAVSWSEVSVNFGRSDSRGLYKKAMYGLATARNGMRKLRVTPQQAGKMMDGCKQYVGQSCTLPEIMYCSRIHPVKPSTQDPFTRACVVWLQEAMGTARRPLSSGEWLALIAFGKLRQESAVCLLTPSHSAYVGFCSLESAEQLGAFIAKQAALPDLA